jgi:hypothetical protein
MLDMPVKAGVAWVHAQEARLKRELPGWSAWPTASYDMRVAWNAGPAASVSALMTDVESPDALIARVRAYEARLPQHIEDARRRIADLPDNGYGKDQRGVLEALIGSLEALAARRAKG